MELFKLLGRVALDNSEANRGIDETTDKAEKAHPKIASAFEKVGAAAVKVGTAIAAGLGAGAVAMGKLIKDSVAAYSDYEQLVGGVETLFKDSSGKVLEYANNAYKTAGMSANDYMETVTSFSASLLQGLDGDTSKAAEIANKAITDMSDNANKMGTDISMIQNAYQGFAKQNYTMLDNLKLGYGGTASEMARLINDSGVLGDKMTVTAETVNSVSFDKIIEAIGVMQDKMDITGTTAKEASTTIQGSISSMKSAWTNFITGMADENQDFDALLGNLVDSMVTVADNLIPRIQMLLPRLVEGLNQLINTLLPYMPEIIESLVPGVIDGALALITGLIAALPQILQLLLAQIPKIVSQVASAIAKAFPVLLQTVKDLFGQIIDFLTGVFANTFGKAFAGIVDSVRNIFNGIVDAVKKPLNAVISVVNNFIQGLNRIKIPDWVPIFGGKGINIPLIPMLAKGGVLEKGQTGFLEGNGAEAVVPLDQNRAWISAVARDMESAGIGGNNQQAQRIIELLELLIDMLPDTMKEAFASMKFDVNNREFARMVKAV